MLRAEELLKNNQIDYTTSGKHARAGWVQIRCPFCSGNPGWHGGINVEGGFYNCWRCGYHWLPKVIKELLRIDIPSAKALIRAYTTGARLIPRRRKQHRPQKLEVPTGLRPLTPRHRQYLEGRGFDPEHVGRVWGVKSSTGPTGFYKHRIFIPVNFSWGVVSYQCLSPTVGPKYLACSDDKEIVPHKHIVYGFDMAVEKSRCVVVEGVTDVWRLGPGAVALFGVKWTQEQIAVICNNFDRVTVMLDADVPKPQVSKLVQTISAHGCWSVDSVTLDSGDPGSLSPRRAREIMGVLGF